MTLITTHADWCRHLSLLGLLDPSHKECIWSTGCLAPKPTKTIRRPELADGGWAKPQPRSA